MNHFSLMHKLLVHGDYEPWFKSVNHGSEDLRAMVHGSSWCIVWCTSLVHDHYMVFSMGSRYWPHGVAMGLAPWGSHGASPMAIARGSIVLANTPPGEFHLNIPE